MRSRAIRVFLCVVLASCTASTEAERSFDGNYAGTATTGASFCGTGNIVMALNQISTVLTGTWTASGFSTVLACNALNANGTLAGQASGNSLLITFSNAGNSGTFTLNGTATSTNISGTYTQTMTNAFTNGTFTLARQ